MDITEESIGSQEFYKHLKNKGFTEEQLEMIMLGYRLSKSGHRNQIRDSGGRYFDHPKTLVLIAVDELGITNVPLLIALEFHDILEDTFLLTPQNIEWIFGPEVRRIVEALSEYKIIYLDGKITKEPKENFHKTFKEQDEKVRTAKLIDRLHNVRTLTECSVTKQRRYIRETEEIYLPLAWKTDRDLYQMLFDACHKIKARL